MYRIERQDQLYKTLLRALFCSPTIVAFSVLTLLLPLSGVFAPGSLTVTTQTSTNVTNCTIPTGDLSIPNTPDSYFYYMGYPKAVERLRTMGWDGVTLRAAALTAQCLSGQRIPDLPQACGPDCLYKVSVPSFVFKCTPNPPSLPYGQAGPGCVDFGQLCSVWNVTTDPTSMWAFYVAWSSTRANKTEGNAGNAYCSPVQAQYDIEVWAIALST
jgi:hypothetical protein